MAEGYLCRMRLQEYADIDGAILGDLPSHIKAARPKLLRIHIVATPADAAGFSEISPPENLIDITTAVIVETISSQANDNLQAGAHGQKIRSIAIDEDDEIVTREENGHATDWTNKVDTTNLYKEIFHTYGSSWGTGDKDFAGNLDIRKIDDTVFVQILAGKNESNGARFKVPDNQVAMLYGGRLRRLAPAAGVFAADEGVRIRIIYIDPLDATTGLVAADRCVNWLEYEAVGAYESEYVIPKGFMFESGTWIVPQHSSKVNAGELYDLTLDFLIWKK